MEVAVEERADQLVSRDDSVDFARVPKLARSEEQVADEGDRLLAAHVAPAVFHADRAERVGDPSEVGFVHSRKVRPSTCDVHVHVVVAVNVYVDVVLSDVGDVPRHWFMGIDVEGWVETSWRRDEDLPEEDYQWSGVIRISLLRIHPTDEVAEALFGFSRRAMDDHRAFPAVARARGVPSRCSVEVRADLEAIARHEAKYGKGEFGGYTHITWREIKAIENATSKESEWSLLFEMMALLETRHRDDEIRIVTWWTW